MKQPINNKQAIGIFGGTFDPIHLGHIEPVVHLAKQLNLQHVKLMPAHILPHKPQPIASVDERLDMVKLVCQQYPIFHLDCRELHRDSKSYTIDSIKELRAENPDSTIYFFIGTDSLLSLETWYQIDALLNLCHFVVSARPGYKTEHLTNPFFKQRLVFNESELLKHPVGKIFIAQTPQLDISSTKLRAELKSTRSLEQFLPESVASYIKTKQLYSPR